MKAKHPAEQNTLPAASRICSIISLHGVLFYLTEIFYQTKKPDPCAFSAQGPGQSYSSAFGGTTLINDEVPLLLRFYRSAFQSFLILSLFRYRRNYVLLSQAAPRRVPHIPVKDSHQPSSLWGLSVCTVPLPRFPNIEFHRVTTYMSQFIPLSLICQEIFPCTNCAISRITC